MVYQDTTGDGTGVPKFAADTKLYNRILTGFSGSDQLNVINNSASVNNRNFAGVGIKTDTIIAFNNGAGNDPHFNRITDISGDGKTLTLASVRTGSTLGSGTAGTLGQALTGTYGDLTLNSNGSYSYSANTGISATEALDAGDVVYDYFNYTVSDGSSTASALITIKIIGVNDNPSATNDTGYINQDETLTVANGASAVSGTSSGSNTGDVLLNETDVDSHDSMVVVGTVTQSGGTNTAGGSVSSNSNTADVGVSITGIYGDLTLNEDGSYSYIANNAASLTDGQTVYAAAITNDLVGISTVKVGLGSTGTFVGIASTQRGSTTVFFSGLGTGVYHSFKTNYDVITGEIRRTTATVSTGETHG